jgi:hypothetical protein
VTRFNGSTTSIPANNSLADIDKNEGSLNIPPRT